MMRNTPLSVAKFAHGTFAFYLLPALISAMLATLTAHAQSLSVLHNFSGSATDGRRPGSVILSGSILYGPSQLGGTTDQGTLFSFDTTTNSLRVLYSFSGGGVNGLVPGGLLESGSTLYGNTLYGGDNGIGTIYSYNTSTGIQTVLHSFQGGPGDGQSPVGSLVLSNSTLYGMTNEGGTTSPGPSFGTIFAFNTASKIESLAYSFGAYTNDGEYPTGTLTVSGQVLYGMVPGTELDQNGAIFSLNLTDGSEQILHYFQGGADDGARPSTGALVQSRNVLYGLTQSGGTSNFGTLFAYNVTTHNMDVLHSFMAGPEDGNGPSGSLVLDGAYLYGVTEAGGKYGNGTIFQFDTTTDALTLLHSFNYTDGSEPTDLVKSGRYLFGTTSSGGSAGDGVLFSLYLPEPSSLWSLIFVTAIFFPRPKRQTLG
jgi:uncharacterized repeat protein (TIGR03803 family)